MTAPDEKAALANAWHQIKDFADRIRARNQLGMAVRVKPRDGEPEYKMDGLVEVAPGLSGQVIKLDGQIATIVIGIADMERWLADNNWAVAP